MAFCELWPSGPIFDPGGGFPLGMDSVLLADFARPGRGQGVELCCGSGAVSLLLLWRAPSLRMDCVELLSSSARCAGDNFAANGLAARARVINGDIRSHRRLLRAGEYSLAVCNPPYFPAGSGRSSPDPARALARSEAECTLSDVLDAASWALKSGGALALVHRPERLAEIFEGMRARSMEPKRLRLVQHTAASTPSLALVEGRRGGAPGLRVEPTLLLRDGDGAESGEYRRIYHMEER